MRTLLDIDAMLEAALEEERLFESGKKPAHPQFRKGNALLRREARTAHRRKFPRQHQGPEPIEVHHRIPLEWARRIFPSVNPNRISNLQGLTSVDHRRKASDLWDAFRAAYRRAKRVPTPRDVYEFARLVDRSLTLPYPLQEAEAFFAQAVPAGRPRLRRFGGLDDPWVEDESAEYMARKRRTSRGPHETATGGAVGGGKSTWDDHSTGLARRLRQRKGGEARDRAGAVAARRRRAQLALEIFGTPNPSLLTREGVAERIEDGWSRWSGLPDGPARSDLYRRLKRWETIKQSL